MRINLIIFWPIAALVLSSCTPSKGYVGPDLPKDKIALVETSAAAGVSLSAESIDGIDLGFGGIEVLPGDHEFYSEVAVSEEPRNCQAYSEFDWSGYRNCQKKNRNCDCFDYLHISEQCEQTVHTGTCRGTIETQAGRRYTAAVELDGIKPRLNFREEGSTSRQSKGECRKDSSHTENISRSVGSGRYEAGQYGIYRCY